MQEINNHVHSTYSFSPYEPSEIPAKAKAAGLGTVGIMDHDSVSGCAEFLDAARETGIAATAGCEVRVNMDGTSVEGRKTNNPDEPNISYIALHGIPRSQFAAVEEFLKPVHDARICRDRKEVQTLNGILQERGAPTLDFNADVVSISKAEQGGSITERHILYALSLKLINAFGKGERLVGFVEERMQIPIPGKLKEMLLDLDNPHYAYDLLGVFKSTLVPEFFIPSGKDECLNVQDVVDFANSIGAIPAYAYLGDVGESPTGDKKAEKFEDDFLDELVAELKKIGFKAITYMPPRNTKEQMVRLQKLCKENELMEISGVDINSSRQSFNCPILLEPEFKHLADAAYALIAHEKLASEVPNLGIFHPENPNSFQTLEERIAFYADIGKRMDHTQPEKAVELI
ncbi:PHP domain-containing protein [Tichowtungia aerotolerans]|uniref:PHP domain-containing protein n=1 Tax=Tichowtungia aerotolerans TaxID=2697043 RepID=A0A6P1M591_9BACT|nr:PHP domain-containing protein [Tichowtungia aerotolerans]QHI69959.1 PHP domain-containing protein [Tichowtungia aerotolerans]